MTLKSDKKKRVFLERDCIFHKRTKSNQGPQGRRGEKKNKKKREKDKSSYEPG